MRRPGDRSIYLMERLSALSDASSQRARRSFAFMTSRLRRRQERPRSLSAGEIHPDVLLAQLPELILTTYAKRRDAREREHRIWSQQVLLGERKHFEPIASSPFGGTVEKEMLLTPHQEWDSE